MYIYKDAMGLKILDAESITQNDRGPLPEYMVWVHSATGKKLPGSFSMV